jgi:hypothetical protein
MTGTDVVGARRALNRTLLALTGLAALVCGGWALVAGLAQRGVSGALPALPDPAAGLDDVSAPLRDDPSTWSVVALCAALAVVLLGLLWWLSAQRGPRAPRLLALPGDGLRLRTRALSRACAQQAVAVPDVTRARVGLSPLHRHRDVRARLVVILAPGAEPGPVLRELDATALEGLRRATGAPVRCAVRLRVRPHTADRVR